MSSELDNILHHVRKWRHKMTPLCQIEFILSKGKLILISNNNIDNIKV